MVTLARHSQKEQRKFYVRFMIGGGFLLPFFYLYSVKILAHVPIYLPHQCSGGEVYLHEMLKKLLPFHNIHALEDNSDVRIYEGVHVSGEKVSDVDYLYQWADVVITHLGKAGRVMNLGRKHQTPIIHIYHNELYNVTQLEYIDLPVYYLYNSNFVANSPRLKHKRPGMVYYPPIRQFKRSSGAQFITLINCNKNKGGQLLIDLAEALPNHHFLGVKGYSKQITADLPNLVYIDNTNEIADVFAVTHTLLVPSKYESFGIAACEAMKAGIRVICNATPGLRESMNSGAIYATNKNDYIYKIEHGNPGKWVEPVTPVEDLNNFLHGIIEKNSDAKSKVS